MGVDALSNQIAEFIKERAAGKLEKNKDESEKQRQLEIEFIPANWLSRAAKRAKQIQIVTHALKYTHTDARGSSIYAEGNITSSPPGFQSNEIICTMSLSSPQADVVGNAAALDVAALLQLESNGKSVMQCVAESDPSPLAPFAESDDQLTEWMEGFSKALEASDPSSHTLAKQIYFPIGDGTYHLIAPLYPSSLSYAVYERVIDARYSEKSKQVRRAKQESAYTQESTVDYPGLAMLRHGGTKPQNVSRLNVKRKGTSFLLNCGPPGWESQVRPPLNTKTVFSRYHFGLRVRRETWGLRAYLLKQRDKTSTMAVREIRARYINNLIDELIQYAAEIQTMTEHAGWSSLPECRLDHAERLWLDPHRAGHDEEFAREREKKNWQVTVADSFAGWLNKQMNRKEIMLGDAEHREWESLLAEKLRFLRDDLEVMN